MFKKMQTSQYPPRRWSLVGYPDAGKSTFAAQMRGPILPIDADQRFAEVAALASDVYQLSDNANDNNDPDRIASILADNMPRSDVQTIVVDSVTAVIQPLVIEAIRANDAGQNKNRIAAFKPKATAMRTLQHAVSRYGADVLWIWHLSDGRDSKANAVTTQTVSATERARLLSSLNMELHIIRDGGKRGIKIIWARRGKQFPAVPVLWDDSGSWQGMPERIERAAYDGLTEADQARIEAEPPPDHFATPEAALDWSIAQGAFENVNHSKNAYDKLKREQKPATAKEMRDLWVDDVIRRKAEAATPKQAGLNIQTEPETTQTHYQES